MEKALAVQASAREADSTQKRAKLNIFGYFALNVFS